MKTINDTDTIFATIVQYGRSLANVKLSGMSSIQSIISYLRSRDAVPSGLSQISIRNSTQGWCSMQSLYIR